MRGARIVRIRDLRRETTSSFLGGTSSTGAQEAIDSAQQPRSERRAGERRGRLMARGRCRFASQSARAVAPRRSTPKSGKRRRGWRKARKAPNPRGDLQITLSDPRRSPRLAIFSRTLSARDCCSSELAQRPSRRRNEAPCSRRVQTRKGRGASGLMIDVEIGIARPTRSALRNASRALESATVKQPTRKCGCFHKVWPQRAILESGPTR